MALVAHWLPGEPPTTENMGTAKWLDDRFWSRHEIATANGIAKAFKG